MQLLRGVRKQRAFTVSCNTVYPPPSIRVALIFYDIKHNTIDLLQKVVVIGLDGRTGTEVAGGPNKRYGSIAPRRHRHIFWLTMISKEVPTGQGRNKRCGLSVNGPAVEIGARVSTCSYIF